MTGWTLSCAEIRKPPEWIKAHYTYCTRTHPAYWQSCELKREKQWHTHTHTHRWGLCTADCRSVWSQTCGAVQDSHSLSSFDVAQLLNSCSFSLIMDPHREHEWLTTARSIRFHHWLTQITYSCRCVKLSRTWRRAQSTEYQEKTSLKSPFYFSNTSFECESTHRFSLQRLLWWKSLRFFSLGLVRFGFRLVILSVLYSQESIISLSFSFIKFNRVSRCLSRVSRFASVSLAAAACARIWACSRGKRETGGNLTAR